MSNNADKFLAILIIEPVPLPTSVSSALSVDNGKRLADQIRLVLSFEMSGLTILLKPWMKRQ